MGGHQRAWRTGLHPPMGVAALDKPECVYDASIVGHGTNQLKENQTRRTHACWMPADLRCHANDASAERSA